jgi:ferredoxin
MTAVIDPGLLDDVKLFGAADVSACFSCGNCTAICPLSDNDGTFPRRMIRYAQVGLVEELRSSKELWTCYHCGLCTETCPTQADPGGFMAAARRHAIATYDRTRLARVMYTRPVLGWLIAAALAVCFGVFMYADHGPRSRASLDLFGFIPEPLIHYTGLVVMVVVAVAGLAGIVTMAAGIARKEGIGSGTLPRGREGIRRLVGALWEAIAVESIGLRRYRADCAQAQVAEPLWRRRWVVHAATMWGFLGLLLATLLDYALALIGVRQTGAPVPVWYPVRLLGTVAGLFMVYGVTVLVLNRIRRVATATKDSASSDWMLLALLWLTGVTGLLLELALYLPGAPMWGYWVLIIHVAVALDLLLLLPFMKFAHAIYRPVALFFHALAAGQREASG